MFRGKTSLVVCLVIVCVVLTGTVIGQPSIAISTHAGWWPQAEADREMQEIVDNVTGASVELFPQDAQDALADWVAAHTGDGVSDLLILCGQFPESIYPGGNAMPEGSLAELFLDDGNTIINTGDYIFYVNSAGNNNAQAGLENMMDQPIGMWGSGAPCALTPDAATFTPSLVAVPSTRPFFLDALQGDWAPELILGQVAGGTATDPSIVRNASTGGRLGIFIQAADALMDIRGEVISEWINNWYLPFAEASIAWLPTPANGATNLVDVVASWLPPVGVENPVYNVYGGTDPAALDLLAEGLTEATFTAGTAGVDLELGTTYYWRVDVNGEEGLVWSFTTEAATFPVEGIIATTDATSGADGGTAQQTVDGSGLNENDEHSTASMEMWLGKPAEGELVSITYEFPRVYKMDEMLVWNSNTGFEMFLGYGFKDVTIEISVDGVEWTVLADVEFAQAPAAEAYAANTTVDMMGVAAKVVKLTANTNWGGGAFPDSGLSEVRFMYIPAQARIVAPADGATGVAPDAELDWHGGRGSTSSDVYINDELIDAVTESTYAPLGLELGATYTWRIDENDGVDIWEGDVWSFSTVASLPVGSLAGQSVDYNNGVEPYITEIAETLDPAVDLSAYGAKALQVAYQVAPINVALAGSATSSSKYDDSWASQMAIDGDLSTGSHSVADDPDKWLEVELDQVYSLAAIVVHNRASCCDERIVGVVAKALDADRNEIYVSEPIADHALGSIHTFTNDGAGFADVKFIRLEGGTDFLQIMEVQALPSGYPVPAYLAVEDSAGQVTVIPADVTGAGTQALTVAIDYLAATGVDVTSVAKIAVGVGDPINPVAGGSGTLSVSNVTVGVPGPVFSEDFEGLPLGPNVDEEVAGDAVWTKTAPAGWSIDDSGMAGVGDPNTDGVTEWAGWSFADKAWWTEAAEDQDRSMFELGTGTVAIADPDEWDDADHTDGYFNSFLATPAIDVSGVMTDALQLTFASSWRPEFDSNYHQTGNITVSFDGGDPVQILLWESDSSSENFKDYATNEMVTVEIDKPAGAQSMVLTFGCFDAGNDWWWAIDNIEIGLL